jgi:pimeloyl-ACP methyl ester carboxylesterase
MNFALHEWRILVGSSHGRLCAENGRVITNLTIIKGYVDSRDGQIHYRKTSNEVADHVVFLHQSGSSSAMFERIMLRLGINCCAIALDTPGFGSSFVPREDPTLAYYAERLLEVVDRLNVQK